MIQANEIRVGNRFTRELRNQRGLEYDHDFVFTEEYMGKLFGDSIALALQDLFPIPLSPEVLLACGFSYAEHKGISRISDELDNEQEEGNTYNWTLNVPKNNHVEDLPRFELVKFGDGEIKFSHQWLRVTVKHLHQLQNLYFSLTGQELIINL